MFPNRTCAEWTILRDTVPRVISLLNFCFPNVRNHSACLDTDVTKPSKTCPNPDEWSHPNFRMLMHNNVCSQFTTTNSHWNQVRDDPYVPWKCDFDDAKRTLKSIDGIGHLDSMNNTLNVWRDLFHLRSVIPMPHSHTTSKKVDQVTNLDSGLEQLILENNEIDLAIDAWAKESPNFV
jgi:hypothetical protein